MNVRMFVTGTATLLAVWLGVTFFTKVSATDSAQRGAEGYAQTKAPEAPKVSEKKTEELVHQPETASMPVSVTQ